MTEDITPIEKQDLEYRFWELSNGGKIQYVKYPINYNKEAIKALVRRAMDMGFMKGQSVSGVLRRLRTRRTCDGCLPGMRKQKSDEDRPDEWIPFLFKSQRRYTSERCKDGGNRRKEEYVRCDIIT